MPSEMTFRTAFGSWSNALRAAGLEPVKWIPTQHGVTRKGTRNQTRKLVDEDGYDALFEPSHPMAKKNGYVRVHRKIAFDAGLLINPSDDVHHKNENKRDNRLENLEVLSKSEHARLSTPKGSTRPRRSSSKCSFGGCDTLQKSRYGLCRRHYKLQWQRNLLESPTQEKP